MRLLSLTSLLLLLSLAACDLSEPNSHRTVQVDTLPGGAVHVQNPELGIWDEDPEQRWRVVEAVRIGSAAGDGPEAFGAVEAIAEDPLGRVWISDGMASEIRVFDRHGHYIRTVGRRGAGPGEFSTASAILVGPQGNLWVNDSGGRRWEVFDTAGVRIAGHPLASNGPGQGAWTSDGRLVELSLLMPPDGSSFHDMESLLATRRLTSSGELVPQDSFPGPTLPRPETVSFTEAGDSEMVRMSMLLPLAHNPSQVVGPNGELWVSEGGGTYTIRRQHIEGDTALIIERDYQPVEASTVALEEAAAALVPRGSMRSPDNDPARIPRVYPPFNDYFPATDGTLWTRRTVEDDRIVFDVFQADGRFLGSPEIALDPAELEIRLITAETIYAVVRDEMDVQSVVFLRIERP